jgi:hypothetical protein
MNERERPVSASLPPEAQTLREADVAMFEHLAQDRQSKARRVRLTSPQLPCLEDQ